MKFEKPTIHMELNGCKVNGFIIGQPHELRLMLSVIAKFATKRLSVGEIIDAVSTGLAEAADKECRTYECNDDKAFNDLAEALIKEVFGDDKN